MSDKKLIVGQLTNCARCGKDHSELAVKPFTTPSIINIGGAKIPFTHWAMCPNVNEPIIILVIETTYERSETGKVDPSPTV